MFGQSLKPIDKILKFLIGDDIFVSYSRSDGATYAAGLATRLTRVGFSCRLDQWGAESGKDMPQSLRNALRRSAALVLVGSEGAARSRHVKDEVQELKRYGRPIVPIVFEGVRLREDKTPKGGRIVPLAELDRGDPAANAAEALWAEDVEGQAMFCEDNALLETGEPSGMVLNRIEKTLTFRTRDQRLRISTAVVTMLLLGLIGASAWAGILAKRSNKRAADAAELEAQALKRLREQTAAAKDASDEAARQRKAAADATVEANKQTAAAAAARIEADHQRQLAADATKNAERAQGIAIGRQASLNAASSRTQYLALEKGWADTLQYGTLLSIEAARRLSAGGIPAADADRALRDALDLLPRAVRKYEHEHEIDAALLSADGKYLITVEGDGVVRIWDSFTHARIGGDLKLEGERFGRNALFNADRTLMITTRNGWPAVWQLPAGTLKWEMREPGVAGYQFSQDGKYVAANVSGPGPAGAANRIVVWDVDNGRKVAETPYQGVLHGFALSPNNKLVALSLSPKPKQKGDAASEENLLQLWQLGRPTAKLLIETQAPRRVVEFFYEPLFLSQLTFSHDGKLIAASLEYHAVVLDAGSLKELTQIGGPERDPDQVGNMQNVETIGRIAFSRDGKTLGIVGDDGDFETWDVLSGRELWHEFDHNALYAGNWEQDYLRIEGGGETRVVDIRTGRDVARVLLGEVAQEADFAPDGERLLLYDKRHVWIYDSGSAQQVARVWRQGEWTIASRSPGGRFVAARSGSRVVVWDALEMRETATLDHMCDLMNWNPAFSVNAVYTSTACVDGTVHIWNTRTGQEVWAMKDMPVTAKDEDDVIQSNVYYVGFSPDGKFFQFEAGDRDKGASIRVWEVSSRREVARIRSSGGASQNGFFSADGGLIVVNGGEAVTVVDTGNGRFLDSLPIQGYGEFKFSPENRLLARTVKGAIEVRELGSRRVVSTMPISGESPIYEFGPHGKILLIRDDAKGIGVLDTATGRPGPRLSPDKFVTIAISAFSPSSRYSATFSETSDKKYEAEVWDLTTGTRVAVFPDASPWGLAFSPGDSYVAAVGPQGLRVKKLSAGEDRTELEAGEPTDHAVFSADGKFFAGIAEDQVNVWETAGWGHMATLPHESKVVSAAFPPGKASLVTVSEYPDVREWILHEDRLMECACGALNRNLSPEEWRKNFGAEEYRATCPRIPTPAAHTTEAK